MLFFKNSTEVKGKMRKKLVLVLLTVIAVSMLSSLAIAYASARPWMGMGVNKIMSPPAVSNRWLQKSWVRVEGIITKWGEKDVNGSLSAFTKTALLNTDATRQLVSASAIWTTNKSRPISALRTKENFTYNFYSAKLITLNASLLNYGNSNFFLNGTWNVYNVTSHVTVFTNSDDEITGIHRDQDIKVDKAYGELNVTDNWTKFTLTITGIDPLTGSVRRSATRQMQFNPFKVTDDLSDSANSAVTKTDLTAVVRCYGAMPGWGNFDNKMDFNNNYKIDITDLTTVAANMQ